MESLDQYKLDDLKVIYQALHGNIASTPALMDSELMHDMQTYLQQQATKQGVDVSLHAQWSSWLNNDTTLSGL